MNQTKKSISPCPFSGDQPEGPFFLSGTAFHWIIRCNSCNFELSRRATSNEVSDAGRAELIDSWNRRQGNAEPESQELQAIGVVVSSNDRAATIEWDGMPYASGTEVFTTQPRPRKASGSVDRQRVYDSFTERLDADIDLEVAFKAGFQAAERFHQIPGAES